MDTKYTYTTFAEQVMRFCEKGQIHTGSDFTFFTFLEGTIYFKLKNDRNYIPSEKIAYTICFGLHLTLGESCYLLRLAGMDIMPRTPDDKYRELLVKMLLEGKTYIPSCNKELRRLGYQELGSRTKKQ